MAEWIGLPVEAQRYGVWKPGKVVSTDAAPDDTHEVFRVQFDDSGSREWCTLDQVRPRTATEKAYQFRRVGGSITGGASPWEDLTIGAYGLNINVPGNSAATKIEIREKPKRTDAEVLEKLRTYARQNPGYLSVAVRAMIAGEW
jgi:hypothetical protein